MKGRESFAQPCIVLDIDGTLCPARFPGVEYADLEPYAPMVDRMREYKKRGYYLILITGRQMQTYEGNVGLMNAHTLPVLIEWLTRHQIPFDELYLGRPWPGKEGFYVCDRTVLPVHFLTQSAGQLQAYLERQKHVLAECLGLSGSLNSPRTYLA